VSNKHLVKELLGLTGSECLGECSRCGESPFPLLQLKVIGHQVALCRSCLRQLLNLLEPSLDQQMRMAAYVRERLAEVIERHGPEYP
jgi:hypothetical protein